MTLAQNVIPLVDISSDSPLTKQQQAEMVKEALATVGFLAIKQSVIPEKDIVEMFSKAKEFYAQPLEAKEAFTSDAYGRGYFKAGKQNLSYGKKDNKESYSIGKLSRDEPRTPVQLVPEILSQTDDFLQGCYDISILLMELFAQALEVPLKHFSGSHTFGKNNGLSLIHYPPLSESDSAKLSGMDIRAGAHHDWGSLTLLFQEPTNATPGLEVYLPPASEDTSMYSAQNPPPSDSPYWYPAPPNALVVNVGLVMEKWSASNYRATLHRVTYPQTLGEMKGRYSMAYFAQPDDDTTLNPVHQHVNPSEKVQTSLELFNELLSASLANSRDVAI